ncbi:hypothetical protein A7981_02740 [Methylovorus sp. MM2]|uniref:M48 family metallopeptidase n=1 Tax=Methylovorus sp. MM2 TaxID=1848038 RepID=UPI0007DECDDA|nr:SprT family zinc-dependent metalloprotease [Methylovorus sp. MM2]OAM52416.1 hypothetical protein A7981_02740 [Methylovorus sp. MM2]
MQALALLDGSQISYTLKRSAKRRSIGLRISNEGLIVSAPMRISLRELNALLQSKISWIQQKLDQQQANAAPELQWSSGQKLLLLGNEIALYLAADTKNRAVEFDGGKLDVRSRTPDDKNLVKRKVIQWYKQQALVDFTRRTALLAQRLGVDMPPVSLSSAKSRWGSCNSRGEIRLNWRLIQAHPSIIHYVVAHELAHLKEMNHSPRFWAIVKTLCPDYKKITDDLKAVSASLHAID